jgi:hypothetical protein
MAGQLRNELAQHEMAAGVIDKAPMLLEKALSIMQAAVGPMDRRLVDILRRQSILSDQRQDWGRSRSLQQRILAILEHHGGSVHPEVIEQVLILGLLEAGQGKLKDAQPLLGRAIDGMLNGSTNSASEQVYDALRAKGSVDSQLQDWRAYADTLRRGLAFISASFGPTDDRIDDFAIKLFQLGVLLIGQRQIDTGKALAADGRRYIAAAGAPPRMLKELDDWLAKCLLLRQ